MKTTQNVSFTYNRMTVISGRPLSWTGTMPLCKDTGRYCETILNVVFQRRLSEVMKTLKFNDCGSTYSVKIESVPQTLTFTLIWCEYSAQGANSTYNKSSGRGKKKKLSALPWLYLKLFGSAAPPWSINQTAWKKSSEKLHGRLVYTPMELFNVEVQRCFYRSASDKLPVSSCSIIVSVHNKHSPINKKSQVYRKSGCRME